jgi:uncharacterized repeat protein (TIGR03803 family)
MSEVVLHNFSSPSHGANPETGVIRDSAGSLYGTTTYGGASNAGVVYKVSASGHQTVLYSFTGAADGANPYGGLAADSAGNLYGTTSRGGTSGVGLIFKIGSSGQETVLHSFAGSDGSYPWSTLIRDSAGNLYGTAATGGTGGWGVAFKLDAAGNETTLYNFTGGADGGFPMGALARDSAGNLYGATELGGTSGAGVVFKIGSSGHETVLYTFTGGADGRGPMGGVIRDQTGNLYGTAQGGGATAAGVIFEVPAAGNESTLYSFTGQSDGNGPEAGLTRDTAGNLYGTTYNGGAASAGVVFKLDTEGHETVLYNFTDGADGGHPMAGVILDSGDNLYGTTYAGGAIAAGAVYKLDTAGSETVLYGFPGGPDGASPYAGVIDSAGSLYGAAYSGGAYGKGIVYALHAGSHETVLYTFTGGTDGGNPSGITRDSSGNLYGTTWSGGVNGDGTVYKIDASGQQTVLHSFGGFDGAAPETGVVLDSAGNLYGVTPTGGTGFAGTVYMLDSSGNETVLYNFTGGADGNQPAGVIRDSAGNLYGTTVSGGAYGHGVVFRTNTGGHETVLYNFTGGADGSLPMAGVIGDSEGNLYGTTFEGGAAGAGVVYKLATNGQETVLYNFAPGAGGMSPASGLILDSAGNLYGTASDGGASGAGTVYKLDQSGNEAVLYSFTGGTDGGSPSAGVVRDAAGNLYGATPLGGKNNVGVVFTLKNAAAE